MVPVLSKDKKPLAPCSEKRARTLMGKGEAKAFWRQGIFCIILQKEPSGIEVPEVVVGIDPGSKRTGVTVATKKSVVLNLLQDTPDWVKGKIETRRLCRRSRRNIKTPYRKCRYNRKIGGIPPSTKARWQAHLRTVNILNSILPVSTVVIENVAAKSKKGAKRWNNSFSPLEVGKKWFESEISKNFKFVKFEGWDTKGQRDLRGFKKTKQKLKDCWEAHNVDSHSLIELYQGDVKPFRGILKCNFLNYYRRQLHMITPIKGGVRRNYGGTLSLGLKRGTLIQHPRYNLSIVGGTSNGRVTLHNIVEGKRLSQIVKVKDCKILSRLKWRTQFLSDLKDGTSLHGVK